MTDLVAPVRELSAPGPARSARLVVARPSERARAMALLTALSGVLYLLNLTVSGYANTYYSMAAQAASQSWSAMFFGSLDASGFITIDKPPLATALMGLSVRLLGLSSFAILLPEALLGVGTVLILYLAVRRSFGQRAALLAGVLMALTPVAVLIFRYDNPDALLTFLLVSAAWAIGRGIETGRTRWALAAAALVGAAFLTKYLQADLVLPVFALVWLVSAPGSLRGRIGVLLASAVTVAVTSLWWVAVVELVPATSRPYIGGSTTNSPLDLLLGYDGLGRIFGNQPGGNPLGSALDGLTFALTGGGPGGATFGGVPGLLRMLNEEFGGQIGWLLPAALLSIASAGLIHRRTALTDRRVAGYLLWGGWLLVHVAVFSLMSGIIHPYYTVVIAPASAALVAAAAVELWDRRGTTRWAGPVLGAGLVVAGVTAWALLERTPDFVPGLGFALLALAVAAAIVVAIPAGELRPIVERVAVALALLAVLAGPLAYAGATVTTAFGGGDPGAGPQAASSGGPGGGPGGGPTAAGGFSSGAAAGPQVAASQGLVDYLVEHQGTAKWIVAANGSQVAAGIQLAAGEPVLTMGGFTGSDPTPTLRELQSLVASGELRYVLVTDNGGGGGARGFGGFGVGFGGLPGGPGGGNAEVSSWVVSACSPVTIDGTTSGLYDCGAA